MRLDVVEILTGEDARGVLPALMPADVIAYRLNRDLTAEETSFLYDIWEHPAGSTPSIRAAGLAMLALGDRITVLGTTQELAQGDQRSTVLAVVEEVNRRVVGRGICLDARSAAASVALAVNRQKFDAIVRGLEPDD